MAFCGCSLVIPIYLYLLVRILDESKTIKYINKGYAMVWIRLVCLNLEYSLVTFTIGPSIKFIRDLIVSH